MSRVDRPTLRCDRCEVETQDLLNMSRFNKIVHEHMSGSTPWDLCPACWTAFGEFLGSSRLWRSKP